MRPALTLTLPPRATRPPKTAPSRDRTPMEAKLDPIAFFSATKALRYCRDTPRPFETPPYNNSLALVNAIESQQMCVQRACSDPREAPHPRL